MTDTPDTDQPEYDNLVPVSHEADVEEVAYLDDGRVRVKFDGTTYTLRRPRLGEFKDLRTQISDCGPIEDAETQFKAVIEAMQNVFVVLSDKRLPADSDGWPAWIVSPKFQTDLLIHWRDIPLAPGGRNRL